MKALLMDAGNTRLRVKAWPQDGQGPSAVVGGREIQPLATLAEFPTSRILEDAHGLSGVLAALRGEQGNPPVVLVSVVPAVTKLLGELWPDLTVVDHRSRLPFSSRVMDLASVGPDRICNVAAACGAGLTDALIVDAGTATTFDVLDGGVFQGGLIAPGMAFAAGQLGKVAARLNPVPFAFSPLAPGRDTETAMAAGAWHAGIGGAEAVIFGLLKDRTALSVILTGGLGHHLSGSGRLWDPDWTLRGAAQLAGLVEE